MGDMPAQPDCLVTRPAADQPMGFDAERTFSWVRKGAATILDQGLISGSNFVVTLALARLLGPESYGAYALVFSVFLLFAMLHQAILQEPMAVLASWHFSDRRREYLG